MRGHDDSIEVCANRTPEEKARDDELREIYARHARLGDPNCFERTLWYLALGACDDLNDVHSSEDSVSGDEWASWR